MAKVTIGGEVFDWDPVRKPMSEALAIEEALKIPYVQYEEGLAEGRARCLAGFVWLVWRRNGREVPLADILSGAVDVDLGALEMHPDEGEGEAGPTVPTQTASGTTAGVTSASSPKSSTSGRGRSGSSTRTSSKA